MSKLIAVVDDEEDIVKLVTIHLEKAGFSVKSFSDADKLFKWLPKQKPELIILDLMLPGTDGLEACKFLKRENAYARIPVIMLTAKGDETDRILGLELGADDYVVKPFSPKELVARVKVVLRRNEAKTSGKAIVVGGISLDTEKYAVLAKGKKIDVTTTEFKILELLMGRPGYVFERERILDHVWGNDKIVLDRTIDVHIKNLREKLASAGDTIKNVRGIGYKIDE
jgi:two-component system phosphate regulon response regulator PhoB/two-component system alkaline phosphatase synthesis response regulator PhoP